MKKETQYVVYNTIMVLIAGIFLLVMLYIGLN